MDRAWDHSGSLDELAPAWVKVLGEMATIAATRKVDTGQYAYEYAELSAVLADARPKLAENGLALFQTATTDGRDVEVWTTIMHTSGQYLTLAPFRLPAGNTAQSAGGSVTYARRYALMAALSLATGDDDGASAGVRETAPPPSQARRAGPGAQGASEGRSGATRQPRPLAPPRTHSEALIREMLATQSASSVRVLAAAFRTAHGCMLQDLDPDRHYEAYEWVCGHLGIDPKAENPADEAWVQGAKGALADAGIDSTVEDEPEPVDTEREEDAVPSDSLVEEGRS